MPKILLLILTIISINALAQNLVAFTDYQKKFYVFDNGNTRQLEFQPIKKVKTGNHCVGYITNNDELKIYTNHIEYSIGYLIDSFLVTDNLVAYKIGNQLYVFENGKKTLLTKNAGDFKINDSIVAYIDYETYFFKAYYNGKIYILQDGLIHDNTNSFITGNNMLVYIDAYNNLKLFYNGKTTELLQNAANATIKTGRNIVAFIDPGTEQFKVFYNNNLHDIEPFKPKSFETAYESVAYIDNMESFKLYSKGTMYNISDFAPTSYKLYKDILIYQQQGMLFMFTNGTSYLVENYIPTSFEINNLGIAYPDTKGNLIYFSNGQHQTLSFEKINNYKAIGNTVVFNQGVNTTKIYFDGKTYEN